MGELTDNVRRLLELKDAEIGKLRAEVAVHERRIPELCKELQHQKELWVVALPPLHALDDRAGIIRFGQLYDPQGSIDKALSQKPKSEFSGCCSACNWSHEPHDCKCHAEKRKCECQCHEAGAEMGVRCGCCQA